MPEFTLLSTEPNKALTQPGADSAPTPCLSTHVPATCLSAAAWPHSPARTLLRCCHRPCCWRSGSPMMDVGTVSTTTRFARCDAASIAAQ